MCIRDSTTTMNIKSFAKIFSAHSGTFDMPARPALSPGTFPERFSFLAILPENKIQRVFLFIINVHARTGDHFFQITSGKAAVLVKIIYRKIHITLDTIGMTLLQKNADKGDHLRYMLCRFRGHGRSSVSYT